MTSTGKTAQPILSPYDSAAPSPFRSDTHSPFLYPTHGFDNMQGNVVQRYADKYLSYDDMDQVLDLMSAQPKYAITGSSKFYRLLETSYVKCKNFIDQWIERLSHSNSQTADVSVSNQSRLIEFLELDQFVFVNAEALRKIITKHDSQRNRRKNKILLSWRWRMDFGVGHRVKALLATVISSTIQQQHHNTTSVVDSSISPLGGEQRKYWVRHKDFALVSEVLAQCLEFFVPTVDKVTQTNDCFSCDSEGTGTDTGNCVGDCDLNCAQCPLTAVRTIYFDNAKRDCFHNRVNNVEGGQLVRVRSYNYNQPGTSSVWVERLVHNPKWGPVQGGSKDSVARFSVVGDNVMPLLRSTESVDVGGSVRPLCTEVQQWVRDKEMYPSIRIESDRLSMRGRGIASSAVWVTMDMHVRMFCTKPPKGAKNPVSPMTCFSEWFVEHNDRPKLDQITLPHTLLTMQLAPGAAEPAFLRRLLDSGIIHAEPNFCKFIHATYAFGVRVPVGGKGEQAQAEERNELEYELDTDADADLDSDSESVADQELLVADRPAWWDSMQLPVEHIYRWTKVSKRAIGHNQLHWFSRLMRVSATEAADKNNNIVAVDLKSFFGNERTFLNWFHSAVITFTIGVGVGVSGYKLVGGFLMAVGTVVGFYADGIYVYRFRLLMRRSTTRDKSEAVFDRFGPVLVTTIVFTAFLVAWLLSE